MIAVIPVAGKGTRMLELTKHTQKSLLQVQDKPFLYFLLSHLKEAGITEMILIVGHMKERMLEFANNYPEFNITCIDQFEVLGSDEYGTLCPVKCVRHLTEPFLCVYGDNLYSVEDIRMMIKAEADKHHVAGFEVPNPERYGVLFENNGWLEKIVEKPKEFMGSLINTGLYKFTPAIFEVIDSIGVSPRGEYELTDAINILASGKQVQAHRLQDYWLDFGKPEDIETINSFLQEQKDQIIDKSF